MKNLLRFLFLFLACGVFGQTSPTTRVNSIAELVALPVPVVNVKWTALVAGYYGTNDGGGGTFYFATNSAAATNFGTVFKPPTAGRWLRDYSGPLNVKWFGAKDDASQNDYTRITNAIAVSGSQGLEFPAGSYRTDTLLTLPSNGRIFSVGGATIRGPPAGLYPLLEITGATNFVVQNLVFDGVNAGDAAGGIVRILTSSNFVLNAVTIRNRNQTVSAEGGGWINGSWDFSVLDCVVEANDFEGLYITNCFRALVRGGIYRNNQNSGIAADNNNSLSIVGVEFSANGANTSSQCSFNSLNSTISGCLFRGGLLSGVHVGHPSQPADFSTVIGNTFVDHPNASILISESKYITVSGNTISNPTAATNDFAQAAINIAGSTRQCEQISVVGNVINRHRLGVNIAGRYCTVVDNQITNTMFQAIRTDTTVDFTGLIVKGNQCLQAVTHGPDAGVQITGTVVSPGVIVSDNFVSSGGNMTSAIWVGTNVTSGFVGFNGGSGGSGTMFNLEDYAAHLHQLTNITYLNSLRPLRINSSGVETFVLGNLGIGTNVMGSGAKVTVVGGELQISDGGAAVGFMDGNTATSTASFGSTGSNFPLNLRQGGSTRVYINTSGQVRIANMGASLGAFTDASTNFTSTGTLGPGQGGTGQTSWTSNSVVFINAAGNLAQDNPAITWNPNTKTFQVTNSAFFADNGPNSRVQVGGNTFGNTAKLQSSVGAAITSDLTLAEFSAFSSGSGRTVVGADVLLSGTFAGGSSTYGLRINNATSADLEYGLFVTDGPSWFGSSVTNNGKTVLLKGIQFSRGTVTGSYTITTAEHFVDCNLTNIAHTLLTAAAAGNGFELIFKDITGNAALGPIEIRAASGDRIDGATNMLLNINYQAKAIHSDGNTNWWIH